MPSRNLVNIILQLVINISVVNVLWTLLPLSFTVFNGVADCPRMIGLPACYIVSAGYSLILLAVFLRKTSVFLLGWIPVALLAVSGTLFELNGIVTCPRNSNDIPMCYFSLLLCLFIGLAYWVIHKIKTGENQNDNT